MDTKIFTLGLSVQATSLYLLLVDLKERQTQLSKKNIVSLWNDAPENLDTSLEELTMQQVLDLVDTKEEIYALRPGMDWKEAGQA